MCEVCAKFRQKRAHIRYGQPPFSLEAGHTLFGDVVGPLPKGKGGVQYIHCLIYSATRVGDAMKLKKITSLFMIKALQRWIRRYGNCKVLVTDNAAYSTSVQFAGWCVSNSIQHIFIAPYQHQSVGLVKRYHQTLMDRILKLRFIYGGSWTNYLESAVRALNEVVHSVTKFAPFDL